MRACQLLCSRAISRDKLVELKRLLLCFCQTFERLYGAESCTPNLHLHCHLHDCISDFGPATVFWLFGCERLNGILGSVPTNHRAIEIQLMRKFIASQKILQFTNSDDADAVIQDLLGPLHFSQGSLKEELPEIPLLETLSIENVSRIANQSKLIPPIKEGCYSPDEISEVNLALKSYFGDSYEKTFLLHKYSSALRFSGELYGSINSLHASSSLVCAKKNNEVFPGFVSKFVMSSILVKQEDDSNRQEKVFFAFVYWLLEHEHKSWFGNSIQVWQKFTPSTMSIIPVTNILCRCAYITEDVKFNRTYKETVTIVIPLNNFCGI